MFEFKFDYQHHNITMKVDMLGHEQVFVDKKLVSSSRKWVLTNRHHIVVGQQPLIVEVKVLSMLSSQYQVSLLKDQQCLSAQVQTFAFSGDNINFSKEELSWQQELKLGQRFRVLANLLYFSLIAYVVLGENVADGAYQSLFFVPVVLVTVAGVALFINESVTDLCLKEPTISPDAALTE